MCVCVWFFQTLCTVLWLQTALFLQTYQLRFPRQSLRKEVGGRAINGKLNEGKAGGLGDGGAPKRKNINKEIDKQEKAVRESRNCISIQYVW